MIYEFSEELQCLAEIEEMFENTGLLLHHEIREQFELLLNLRDELACTTKRDNRIAESILEDISSVTRELTVLVVNRHSDKNTNIVIPVSSTRYN